MAQGSDLLLSLIELPSEDSQVLIKFVSVKPLVLILLVDGGELTLQHIDLMDLLLLLSLSLLLDDILQKSANLPATKKDLPAPSEGRNSGPRCP